MKNLMLMANLFGLLCLAGCRMKNNDVTVKLKTPLDGADYTVNKPVTISCSVKADWDIPAITAFAINEQTNDTVFRETKKPKSFSGATWGKIDWTPSDTGHYRVGVHAVNSQIGWGTTEHKIRVVD